MSYRPVSVAPSEMIKANPGPRPDLAWLSLSKLFVDADYQRPLERANWAHIRRIAKTFDWRHFTPVMVAPIGDGSYVVIDGQHRCHAALMAGCGQVPCVVSEMGQQEQARAFAAINSQVTGVSLYHLYRAALAACDPWAVTAKKVVEDAGCRLMTSHASSINRKPRDIYPIGLIKGHVEAGRGAIVTAGLQALCQSANADSSDLWKETILRPMFAVLQENPRALRRDLGAFIRAHEPLKTSRGVDLMRSSEDYQNVTRVKLFNSVMNAQIVKWLASGAATS